MSFKRKDHLKVHVKAKHQQIKIECENCKRLFHPSSLARHKKNVCNQAKIEKEEEIVHEFLTSNEDPMFSCIATEIIVGAEEEFQNL